MANNLSLCVGLYYFLYSTIFSIPNVLLLVIFIKDQEYRKLSTSKILMNTCIVELVASSMFAAGGVFTLVGETPPLLLNKILGAMWMSSSRIFYDLIVVLAVNRFVVMLDIRKLYFVTTPKFTTFLVALCYLKALFHLLLMFFPNCPTIVYSIEKLSWKSSGEFCEIMRWTPLVVLFELGVSFVLYASVLVQMLLQIRTMTAPNRMVGAEVRVFVQSLAVTVLPILERLFHYIVNLFVPNVGIGQMILTNGCLMLLVTANPYVYIAVNKTVRKKYKILVGSMLVDRSKVINVSAVNESKPPQSSGESSGKKGVSPIS